MIDSRYLTCKINKDSIDEDLLSDIIFSNGGLGIEDKGDFFLCSFNMDLDKAAIRKELSHFMSDDLAFEENKSENWMERWKENFHPVEIGQSFIVKPTWIELKKSDRIIIDIDPKMAFGTGTHETTQLILELLPQYIKTGHSVLDAGTGSGILAIAAEKLGAAEIVAFDNDPVAMENCAENINMNHCNNITWQTATSEQIDGQFDIVIANINKNILIEIHQNLIDRMKSNGILILSGLLIEDKQDIAEIYGALNLSKELDKGEWSAMVFER